MFDDTQRLRDNPHLAKLLSHYALLGANERASWQDRLMQMEGIDPKELSHLHGELIAFGWIEQNTGQAVLLPNGVISACYRITLQGLRDSCQPPDVEHQAQCPDPPETKVPRFPRKKTTSDAPEVLVAASSQ